MVTVTSDYIIIITVELVSKNSYRTLPMVMVTVTSDYIIVVAVELASKNSYRTYPYHVLW